MLITHSFTSEITSWKMSTHDFYFNHKYYTFLKINVVISYQHVELTDEQEQASIFLFY